ncbi:MAG: prolyl oligopeptidase family serine peptidase [Gemmatimonadota bacterium]|jgi:dipeptidyl aminopeptidase/acylaminoacyl peptidase
MKNAVGIATATILLAAPFATARAQQPATRFELTVANIMRGPEHVGLSPSGIQWTDDGRWIYFRWLPGGHAWDDRPALHRVPARGGTPEQLTDEQADSVAVLLARGPRSPDDRWRAVSSGGDLYLIDRRSLAVRRLTHTRDSEGDPVFSRDGTALYYMADDNLFELDIERGGLRQVTDLRTGPAPSEPPAARGQRRFLEEQQEELFAHIRRQRESEAEDRARREERNAEETLKPAYLERDERIFGLEIEPGGTYALVTTGRTGGSSTRRVVVPFWVTESGYTETREIRTKVGDTQVNRGRIGIVSLHDGDVRWLELPSFASPGDTARLELSGVRFIGWNDAGTAGLIGARSANFKDAWLWTFDAATGRVTEVAHDHDDAWIDGPCPLISCVGWMPDSRTLYFASERSGFAHLYTVGVDGQGLRQLTRGDWEVQGVEIAPDKDRFYLTTNEGSPHEVHFYHMDLDGSDRTRVTMMPGRQDATPSPDGSRLAFVHSYANTPPELYVAENAAGKEATRITTTPTAEWRAGPWIAPEIIHITASDGVQVPARIYEPADLGASPNGAAVIFVHGAGYLQNVHDWWSSYYREYMFNHLLASRGYVVLDIDYRGSAGYGRDWRTAIYRHMGGKDLSDQVDGVRYLQQTYGIDPERVGIYGGSYGGFITLMALFTAPESFGAGAALRSVTDWAHYNHGYTGAILNLPQNDSIAYQQSSPIYFAEGLEDPLLIAHGMVDTNVHFSDVVRLAQRLIELGKRNWEMAVYPVENHGFVEPTSWTDEYRRILELFEANLR